MTKLNNSAPRAHLATEKHNKGIKMKKIIITASIALFGLTYAQVPNTFVAKAPAKAADVNANFTYLYNQIVALQTGQANLQAQLNLKGDSLKIIRDSLTSLKSQTATSANLTALQADVNALKKDSIGALRTANASTNTNVSSLQTSLATYYLKTDADNKFATQTALGAKADSSTLWTKSMPLGSVIALLTAPNSDGTLPNSNGVWVLSAGQNVVGYGTAPDLRGAFLRGIDVSVAGQAKNNRDSSQTRSVGSYQVDAFQEFGLSVSASQGGALSGGVGFDGGVGGRNLMINSFIERNNNGTPRTSSETRPKNVAVYWYVKVK